MYHEFNGGYVVDLFAGNRIQKYTTDGYKELK